MADKRHIATFNARPLFAFARMVRYDANTPDALRHFLVEFHKDYAILVATDGVILGAYHWYDGRTPEIAEDIVNTSWLIPTTKFTEDPEVIGEASFDLCDDALVLTWTEAVDSPIPLLRNAHGSNPVYPEWRLATRPRKLRGDRSLVNAILFERAIATARYIAPRFDTVLALVMRNIGERTALFFNGIDDLFIVIANALLSPASTDELEMDFAKTIQHFS
ncbi:MAG: hypothetical protein QXS54_00520 [Candidatus Methanomethylicaceae archaeon]